MACLVYKAETWITPHNSSFIYSHVFNRPLSHILHTHDFYEFFFLFNGSAKHYKDGIYQDLHAGDVIFIKPKEVHQFLSESSELEVYSLSVLAEEMEHFLKAYHMNEPTVNSNKLITFSLNRSSQHSILSIFRQLNTWNKLQREVNLRIIIGTALQEYTRLYAESTNDWFDRIIIKMKQPENIREGVPAFLQISNLSHSQLCRIIKKRTGKTPQQFVKELRMDYAYELILSTTLSFEEISLMIGYSSFSHFSTLFKKWFGVSPTELRKMSILL